MKIVQKSLVHTGYFVLEDGSLIPAFTSDLVGESMMIPQRKYVRKIYGALNKGELKYLVTQIKEFKEKHGIIPQNLTAYLRTGFFSNGELKQAHNTFIYK